jgi:DNA-binding protein
MGAASKNFSKMSEEIIIYIIEKPVTNHCLSTFWHQLASNDEFLSVQSRMKNDGIYKVPSV